MYIGSWAVTIKLKTMNLETCGLGLAVELLYMRFLYTRNSSQLTLNTFSLAKRQIEKRKKYPTNYVK